MTFVRPLLGPLALLLVASASPAAMRLDLTAGSTWLGSSKPHAVSLGSSLFDDATAEAYGIRLVHLASRGTGGRAVGGAVTASLSQRGADARIVSALAVADWTFRRTRRLQPWAGLGLGACHTRNSHLGVVTEGDGPAASLDGGLRVALGASRAALDVGWTGLAIRSRGTTAFNETIQLGLSLTFGRPSSAAGRPLGFGVHSGS